MARTLRAIALQTRIALENYRLKGNFEEFLTAELEKVKPRISPENPNLVVFPEDVGVPLVVLGSYNAVKDSKTLDESIAAISKKSMDYVLASRVRNRASVSQGIFFSKESNMRRIYETHFSMLAQDYNTYILAGTIVLPLEQQPMPSTSGPLQTIQLIARAVKKRYLYNTAYLFGPNGDILLRQRKVNLIPIEKEGGLGLSPGTVDDLQTYNIEGVPIGVTVCYDAFFPEIARHLAENGAKILVDPSANPEPWTKETEGENAKGLYSRVQEEAGIVYGIQAMLTGTALGLTFEGKSSIITKRENTSDGTGIICQAKSQTEPEVLVADLSV
jgi:predicted amidohydrolase